MLTQFLLEDDGKDSAFTYHLDRWCIDDVYLTATGGSDLHTVTFAETTSLAGVTIEILGMTDHSFFGSTGTDENGIASYALADGDYYVSLMKAGYEYYWYNSILVAGEPLLYEFTMVDKGADYTVTFENTAALAGIEIQIFDNQEWYTVWLSTDASGVATAELPNGSYRFGANKAGYDTFVSGFAVADAATTVAIDMVPTPATAESLPFLEEFSGFAQDGFPDGWKTNYPTNWLVNYGSFAGGVEPELMLNYWPTRDDMILLVTPAIDATTASGLQLSFKQNLSHYATP